MMTPPFDDARDIRFSCDRVWSSRATAIHRIGCQRGKSSRVRPEVHHTDSSLSWSTATKKKWASVQVSSGEGIAVTPLTKASLTHESARGNQDGQAQTEPILDHRFLLHPPMLLVPPRLSIPLLYHPLPAMTFSTRHWLRVLLPRFRLRLLHRFSPFCSRWSFS
jgi:hypothetical protein